MARLWSEQQKAIFGWFADAITTSDACLVVRARAGTGKTTTIVEALKYIPASVKKVLVCAFAKKNKLDFDRKLDEAGVDRQRVEARTLNSLGFKYVLRNRRIARDNGVDDQVEWDRINTVAPGLPNEVASCVKKLVDFAKNIAPFGTESDLADLAVERECCPENGFEAAGWTAEKVANIARKAMDLAISTPDSQDRISFNDQLFLPVACGWVTADYDVIVVDEAQDQNACQLLLAQKAVKRGGHIIVVGDEKQAIYGFRGADSGALDRLKTQLNAQELGLTVTYRCGKAIVALAQTLVPDYQAAPSNDEGTVTSLPITALTETVRVNEAVLSRTNAPLVSLCLAVIRKGTAARIEGRDIGRDLANITRKLGAKKNSVPAFLTALKAWGEKQKARIRARAKSEEKAVQPCQNVDDKVETISALAEGCVSVSEVIDRCVRLFEDSVDAQGRPNPKPAVTFSSVHKAKGLEWDTVYVLEGTLYCGGRRHDQEETNIHYVAITRAKSSLVLVKEVK